MGLAHYGDVQGCDGVGWGYEPGAVMSVGYGFSVGCAQIPAIGQFGGCSAEHGVAMAVGDYQPPYGGGFGVVYQAYGCGLLHKGFIILQGEVRCLGVKFTIEFCGCGCTPAKAI